MAYSTQLRLPVNVLSALKSNAEATVSAQVTGILQDYLTGQRTLDLTPKKPEIKQTSITCDPVFIEQVKAFAEAHSLTFTKAVTLMLEQALAANNTTH